MKTERRHELQQNDLATALSDPMTLLRLHSNKILIGIILICVVVMLLRYRANASAQASLSARNSLNSARAALIQLKVVEQMGSGDVAARAKQRRDLYAQVNATLDSVLDGATGSGDSTIRAETFVTRGDLNWEMANLPALPGAATRPELTLPKKADDYLDIAEQAYRQVVSGYPDAGVSRATAILGLAAIAENRGDWKAAAEQYDKLTTDASADKTFKDVARQRLAILPQIQSPIFLGSFSSTQPTTMATTQPATMAVETSQPTSAPTPPTPTSQP